MTPRNALICVGLIALALPGCGKGEKERAAAAFSVEAARASLQRLHEAIISKDPRAIEATVPPAQSNLQAVGMRLAKESPTRKEERLAAAAKALAAFDELRPQLMRISADEAKAKFAQILALLDQVEAK